MKKLLLLLIPILTSCSSYYYTQSVSPQSYSPAYEEVQVTEDTYPVITLNNWNVYSSQWNSYLYNPYYISNSTFWYFNSPNNYTWNCSPWSWNNWNYGYNYYYGWNYNWYNGWYWNYGWNNWHNGCNWNYGWNNWNSWNYNINPYNNIWISNNYITNNYFSGKSLSNYKKPLNVEKKPVASKPINNNLPNTYKNPQKTEIPKVEPKQEVSIPQSTKPRTTNTYQNRPQISNSPQRTYNRPQISKPQQNNYQQRNQTPIRSTTPRTTTPSRTTLPKSVGKK